MATRVIREERPVVQTVESRGDYYRGANIVYLITGLVELMLGLRFAFLLLGANQGSGFVTFVYALTYPLVAPFNGIFGTPSIDRSTFDPATLVAMVIYAVIGWAIVRLVAAAHRTPADEV
ncbi:MAG TPA: YggT family protein [Candidatus Saccharimonadia bacterium]|jgi:hypothetical protein